MDSNDPYHGLAATRQTPALIARAGLLIVVLLALLSVAPVAASASLPTNSGLVLGGLDLTSYCAAQDATVERDPEPLSPEAVNSWRCVSPSGSQSPVNMQDACRAQYPVSTAIAEPVTRTTPTGWTCFLSGPPPKLGRSLGGLNFAAYCAAQSESASVAGSQTGYPGNNWRCETSDGVNHPIYMIGVCHEQYHVANAIAVIANLENAYHGRATHPPRPRVQSTQPGSVRVSSRA